ncbi:MAG: hypothetical protein WA160_03550 [Pseudobdellovibrio sp.]
MNLSIVTAMTVFTQLAFATLTPTLERGEKNIYFDSPNGVKEVCVLPKHYPDVKYNKKDLNKEIELCSYSFYDSISAEEVAAGKSTVAMCAKENSTNPAINIYGLAKDLTKESLELADCKSDDAVKIGKYKNSTSCSYTPSILGYYHVSRILGGIGRVPPSVLRTMDIQTHVRLAEIGVNKTRSEALIHTTWNSLLFSLKAGLSSSKKDLLMTDDGRQSYGVFIVNPKKEMFYKELFSAGEDRAEAFELKNIAFGMLKNQSPISSIVKNQWTAENIQKLLIMRDTSEFILLDHLLDQQDRFGNIAYQDRFVYRKKNSDTEMAELEFANDISDFTQDKSSGNTADLAPLKIKSMILKDNDCGVSKVNLIKNAGLLKLVAHMNPKTYKRVMQFQRSIADNKTFFTSNLLFTQADYEGLVDNLNDAASILTSNCKSGLLKLDLDIETYLTSGSVTAASCEID